MWKKKISIAYVAHYGSLANEEMVTKHHSCDLFFDFIKPFRLILITILLETSFSPTSNTPLYENESKRKLK